MQGSLILSLENDFLRFDLGRNPNTIGSAANCDLQISAPGIAPVHCTFQWDARSATWTLTPASAESASHLRVNSGRCDGTAYLQDGDIIELPDVVMRFNRSPSSPMFQGREVTELPLRGLPRLVFGRPADPPSPDPKIDLDAEDSSISRIHAVLEQAGAGEYHLSDESAAGSFLNGQRFKTARLTIGDRFRIGAYNFEFTGRSIKRVANVVGGKIEARHLTLTVGDGRAILNDVSLDVERCSFVGILGGSGQGKSTLMNALCGINPATSGEVQINGIPLSDTRDMRRVGIGYVPQDDIVHRELTVEQAVTYSARLRLNRRTPARAIATLVDETIERLGLSEHRFKRITMLSGGQRKRVSIATELLAKPAVLFLDEPSSGLDPATEFALMSLLRSLAATDCTVICTTHVLGRAYLFDKICVVQEGHIVFEGLPADALEHFGVDGLEEIYLKLAGSGQSGIEWRRAFEQSRLRQDSAPRKAIPSPATVSREAASTGAGYIHTQRVLLKRQWSVLRADLLNLVFLLAQPLFIGAIVGWVSEDEVLRMFLCVVATLWFGCSNGAQQIVRELPIFRRERVCGQGINAYIQSKYLFLTAITALQALLLLGITIAVAHAFHPPDLDRDKLRKTIAVALAPDAAAAGEQAAKPVLDEFSVVTAGEEPPPVAADAFDVEKALAREREQRDRFGVRALAGFAICFRIHNNLLDLLQSWREKPPRKTVRLQVAKVIAATVGLKLVALFATACVGVAMGLAISALVQNGTQAVMWVPLVLIPQILFGGFVVTRPEMSLSVRVLSTFVPSYSAQRLMDVANIYGQTTPRMSNRTKYPVFLTPGGEQETVEWMELEKEVSEQYDKVSDHNTSWQNLLVFPQRVGQHKHVYRIARGKKIYDQTTDQRNDVRYPMGVTYRYLRPAVLAGAVLGAWVAACYLVTGISLLGKQRGT